MIRLRGGKRKPEVEVYLEDLDDRIRLEIGGYTMLTIEKMTHKVKRIGSVPASLGFDLDSGGHVVMVDA